MLKKLYFAANKGLPQKLIFPVVFLILVVAFSIINLPGGDDWRVFYGAARRVVQGVPLYDEKIEISHFYNPPWLAILFAPISMLPWRWGWGILSAASLCLILLILKKWNSSTIKMFAVFLSPPVFYLLLHGEVDMLILGVILLPREYWLLGAITKPQTAIALALGAIKSKWYKTILITVVTIAFSFLVIGNWVPAYLGQPINLDGHHNVWLGLWPFQVVIGVVLALIGLERNDERFFVGASPFFAPYAATSTLLGPWMLFVLKIKDWQAIAALITWWAASIYRQIV